MKKKIFVIGENSLLAKNFIRIADDFFKNSVISCSHKCIPKEFSDFDYVINFSFNPMLYKFKYEKEYDQDLKIANSILKSKKTKLIIISSRQIYGVHEKLNIFREQDLNLNNKISIYGLNKIKCENNVKKLLFEEDRLIIIRSANIFGSKVGGNKFTEIALNTLVNSNVIRLNSSRVVVKDFLPIENHSQILCSLINNNVSGIFNVGSGVKMTLGDLCNAFIEGYGSGDIVDEDIIDDQFMLDISKIKKYICFEISKNSVLNYAYNIGYNLRTKK